ncbi:unnamed protein product, partial [Didymodactylos carnosus]
MTTFDDLPNELLVTLFKDYISSLDIIYLFWKLNSHLKYLIERYLCVQHLNLTNIISFDFEQFVWKQIKITPIIWLKQLQIDDYDCNRFQILDFMTNIRKFCVKDIPMVKTAPLYSNLQYMPNL